ncbi:permease prefix domain 1-containing protein [Lysinibacillus sp. NPDC093197]|uniref:permease prefix domain 1-containing protein n=1 Tax=Lysinibacillus sp. NPDC093197 TaxID=3364132 RepID=UPI00381B01AB
MKQIESYVDEVYRSAGGNKKEIEELKAEMKNHLIEAVHELKSEGKSEKEAINIAIERFGGEQELRSVVRQLFNAQKVFAKWMLYLAIGVFLFTVTAFGIIMFIEEENANENSTVATDIFSVLKGKAAISKDMEEEIKSLVQEADQISKVEIYNVSDVANNNLIFDYVRDAKPDYRYEQKVWNPTWLKANFFPYGNGDGKQWYVDMETRHIGDLMAIILFSGIAIYLTLFTIWAIINAYHYKRLNVGWIFVFALFNVIGYLIYYISGKRESVV